MKSLKESNKSSFFNSVDEFVQFVGGDHNIQKILIANNGIGAVKAIRSIRRWAYETFGDERKIQFVAMATPEDLNANAEYIRLADEVVDVPGGSNNNNYANVNLICEIADRLEVDAVMPLWGHASENPNLPASLLKCNRKITFMGPQAEPMQALGDKIGSTIIAQSAGVPTIAWNGDHLKVDYKVDGISAEVYNEANVKTTEEAIECCTRIGFPVMIKASEGGGGKGIRKVLKLDDVATLFRQVQGEVPGSPIFVMKLATSCRHIEVQLIADKYGDAIALSGRDCSVQRRHQKIIEEGPPVATNPTVFREMERAAVALAKTVGYSAAGTVEYLYVEETQEFAFLELNPRLQVEHPVTENILGINLPAILLQIAMGAPLHRIGDIRKLYNRHPNGKDTIDYEYSEPKPVLRHCIAVRVTAENPESGFQPTSGVIEELHFRSSPDVWGYFSVNGSSVIHEFADSQFGHVFAHGVDREAARRAMVVALRELEIRGEIRTTMEYIVKLLQSEAYVNNQIDTAWLDHQLSKQQSSSTQTTDATSAIDVSSPKPIKLIAICGAALQGFQQLQKRGTSFVDLLRVGQIPSRDSLAQEVDLELIYEGVKFKVTCVLRGPKTLAISCNGDEESVTIRLLSDGGYLMDVAGKSHVAYLREEGNGCSRLLLDGQTCLFTPETDPSVLSSPVAGKIAKLLVPDGSHLAKGDAFVEIEVMKMYMSLRMAEAGTVHFQRSEGATLKPGDVIANVTLDRPESVVKAELFTGKLKISDEETSTASRACSRAHITVRELSARLNCILAGFAPKRGDEVSLLPLLREQMKDPLLPVLEIEEAMSVLRGRMDQKVFQDIEELVLGYSKSVTRNDSPMSVFPAAAILTLLHHYHQSIPLSRRSVTTSLTAQLWSVVEQYMYPSDVRLLILLLQYADMFLKVEQLFDSMSFTDVVSTLRKDYSNDLMKVVELCCSHINLPAKSTLMLEIIECMKSIQIPPQHPKLPPGVPLRSDIMPLRTLKRRLGDLSKLRHSSYSRVSLAAALTLMEQKTVASEQRRDRLHDAIMSALSTGEPVGGSERTHYITKFVRSNIMVKDLLLDALQQDREYQVATLEMYLRKVYEEGHHLSALHSGFSLQSSSSAGNESFPCTWLRFMYKSRLFGPSEDTDIRSGVFAVMDTVEETKSLLPPLLTVHGPKKKVHAVHVIIMRGSGIDAASFSKDMALFLRNQEALLQETGVVRVSFFVGHLSLGSNILQTHSKSTQNFGHILTFRSADNFEEDYLCRNIVAPHAYYLDLPRLSNFDILHGDGQHSLSGNVHLYKVVPKGNPKALPRYFARLVHFTSDSSPSSTSMAEAEAMIVETLETMELVIGQDAAHQEKSRTSSSRGNHIFMNILAPDTVIQPSVYEVTLRRICNKYASKLNSLAVAHLEIKLTSRLSTESSAPTSVRLVASDPTGHVLRIDEYVEKYASEMGASWSDSKGVGIFTLLGDRGRMNSEVEDKAQNKVFCSVAKNGTVGPWHGLPVTTPYNITEPFESVRAEAKAATDTLYVYDWPLLFQRALEVQWEAFLADQRGGGSSSGGQSTSSTKTPEVDLSQLPSDLFTCEELVLCDAVTGELLQPGWIANDAKNAILKPTLREPGKNDCGMVAFEMSLRTPEYPVTGRRIVVIVNDITREAGSFGTREDAMFYKASEYARKSGLPRLYLAANSGARIGLAQSLKNIFRVCWTDENDPSKGFRYIYLTKADYEQLLIKVGGVVTDLPVVCSLSNGSDGSEPHYIITDIVGEETDLGVENLSGSGLIAGETSRAYDDIFTLTLAVGRTVGIGAYLLRLGQRAIQNTDNSPIILTGYQALNKLMGRDIYCTNDQLGGPAIMFHNGVSHLLAESHLSAINQALKWLAFIPAYRGALLPIRNISGIDTINRLVTFIPQKGATYDPRLLLCGTLSNEFEEQKFGFFDTGSFVETLAGWAKTVVVGRARLGGIPMGVIITENRTAEATKPADPADATSREKMVQQAGGVWFPDSAYKTAQALKDFNREELPCIIFANWRGFSGGQRDMFDEVLKFGSMIVDALVGYKQPLFVYIPPHAELRGGAWVVVDSTINDEVMEFYAAEDARGGVLEAAGAASIKFRDRDVLAAARRLDPVLIDIYSRLKRATGTDATDLKQEASRRESKLMGVYQQLAVHFADLHDTPGRMVATGVVRKQVDWAVSRTFFYWRLRRRLAVKQTLQQLISIAHNEKPLRTADVEEIMKNWYTETSGSALDWSNDKIVAEWYETHLDLINDRISILKQEKLGDVFRGLISDVGDSTNDLVNLLKQTLVTVDIELKGKLIAAMSEVMKTL